MICSADFASQLTISQYNFAEQFYRVLLWCVPIKIQVREEVPAIIPGDVLGICPYCD